MANEQKQPPKIDLDLQGISTRNYLIISVVFFLAFIAFIIWGIIPAFNQIFDNRSKLATEQQNLTILEEKLNQVRQLTSSNEFAQAETVNNTLYDTNPVVEVLHTILEVRDENNLTFDRFEYAPGLVATASAQFAQRQNSAQSAAARNAVARSNEGYTIYIEAKGSYYNLVHFLSKLENYAPFSSVGYSEIRNNLLGEASSQIEILAQYYTPKSTTNLMEKLPTLNDDDQEILSQLEDFIVPDYSNLGDGGIVGGKTDLFTLGELAEEVSPEEILEEDLTVQ